jgi:SAM-dependent methyltransferase
MGNEEYRCRICKKNFILDDDDNAVEHEYYDNTSKAFVNLGWICGKCHEEIDNIHGLHYNAHLPHVKNDQYRKKRERRLEIAINGYWKAFKSSDNLEVIDFYQWSEKNLDKGVISRALYVLDSLIKIDSDQNLIDIEFSEEDNIVKYNKPYNWNSIRLSIIGIDTKNSFIPSRLPSIIKEISDYSLTLCVLPFTLINGWQEFVSDMRKQNRFLISLFPIDIHALVTKKCSFQAILEYKLHQIFLNDVQEIDTQFNEKLFNDFIVNSRLCDPNSILDIEKEIKQISGNSTDWAEHPKLNDVVENVKEGRDCLLIGKSSCGKSILALKAGQQISITHPCIKVGYVDVGSVSPHIVTGILRYFYKNHNSKNNHCILIDDLQSNPLVANYFIKIIKLLKKAGCGGRITILAISWQNYSKKVMEELPNVISINIEPYQAKNAIINKYGREVNKNDIDYIVDIAKDDVLILRLMLESPYMYRLDKKGLAKIIWEKYTRGYQGNISKLKRATFIASSLGQFEFELTSEFLENEANVDKEDIDSLIKLKLLRKICNKKLNAGHRSICLLFYQWLSTEKDIIEDLRNANKSTDIEKIADNYIHSSEPSDIWALLVKLADQCENLIDFHNQNTMALIDIWKSMDSLINRINEQQRIDHTWENNLESAAFAIEALCALGKQGLAKPSIEFMRRYWSLNNGRIEIKSGTSEKDDFIKIKSYMEEEDKRFNVKSIKRELAGEINFDKFYQTWIQGFILCAEAAYKEKSADELQKLAIAVENSITDNNFFYPNRVPWCTARVLIGLSKCGRTCDNSDAIKKVSKWLLLPIKEGGAYSNGFWKSGTGTFNSSIETTSMCIIALNYVKSDDINKLNEPLEYILSKKADWIQDKRELDAVNMITAYVTHNKNWDNVRSEVRKLLKWANDESSWKRALKSGGKEDSQSCVASIVADYLINAAWISVRNEIPKYISAFSSLQEQEIGTENKEKLNIIEIEKILFELFGKTTQVIYSDSKIEAHSKSLECVTKRIQDLYRSNTHIKWLDVGCGEGRCLNVMHNFIHENDKREHKIQYLGIDSSKDGFLKAKEITNKFKENMECCFDKYNVEKYICNDSYDLVTAIFLIHEIPPAILPLALKNMISSLRPDGQMIIYDFHEPIEIENRIVVWDLEDIIEMMKNAFNATPNCGMKEGKNFPKERTFYSCKFSRPSEIDEKKFSDFMLMYPEFVKKKIEKIKDRCNTLDKEFDKRIKDILEIEGEIIGPFSKKEINKIYNEIGTEYQIKYVKRYLYNRERLYLEDEVLPELVTA